MKTDNWLYRVGRFYRDGFREMTWGRELWVLIILKVIILFLVLRLFFFQPALAGKSEEEKSDTVGRNLIGNTAGVPSAVHQDNN